MISRSNLLRRTSDGQPLDRAALILSNAGFLGCFVRPLIATALGLTPVGFNPSHPFFWGGRVPLAIPGGLPTGIAGVFVNSMMAGIDGTNLRLLANIEADGIASAFTVTASVDMTFSFTAGIAGSSLTFTVAPLGTPSVQSNLSIAWWVYVAAFVVAGMTLDAVLAAIQAFGGSILNGPIARSIAIPSIPMVGIPLVGPPMTVRATSLGQADAPVRTITISLPVGSIAFPDQFRANDIIVNFV